MDTRACGVLLAAFFLVAVNGGCAGSDRAEASRTSAVEVSPELELDPPALGPAAGEQPGAGLVRAGDHYLAVWIDDRASFGLPPSQHRFDLMGARIDPSGAVLDPTGFRIVSGPTFGGAVPCNPDGLCLFVSSGNAFDPQARLIGVRVLGNQVLDPTPLTLTGPGSRLGTVTWDGSAFRLLWATSAGVFMASVGVDGAVSPAVPVQIEDLQSLNANPGLDCGGPRCLITYLQSNGIAFDVMGRMLDADGSAGDEFAIASGFLGHFGLRPFWDGARYWVAVRSDVPPVAEIRLVRVESDGTILDPDGLLVGSNPSVMGFALGHDDTQLVVSWQISSHGVVAEFRSARVTTDGEVLDPGGVPFFITPSPPNGAVVGLSSLACHTESCMLGILHSTNLDSWVRGIRMVGATVVDPEGVVVTASPPGQADAAAAFGMGRYFTVWQDARLSDRGTQLVPLRGAIFSPDMEDFVRFETDQAMSGGFGARPETEPTAAASASSYLVAWTSATIPSIPHVYGEVFDAEGAPIRRTFPVQETNRSESRPSAASSGDGFLVAWERIDLGAVRAIRASRFDTSGTPLPPEHFMITNSGFLPATAFDGTSYLVVWQRPKSATDAVRDLAAARITTDGVILDPAGIVIADTSQVEHSHSVACGGGVCVIAWHSGAAQVRALRITPEGTVLDPGGILLASATKSVAATSVAFDGTGFLVTWQTKSGDLHATEVSPDGVITAPEFVIANEGTALQNPVAASDGAGHRLVLYDRFDPSVDYNVRRVRARVLDP